MPYKLKRRGDDLEIHEDPAGNCRTLDDVQMLIHQLSGEFDIDGVYMIGTGGRRIAVEWSGAQENSDHHKDAEAVAHKSVDKTTVNKRLADCPDCHGSVSKKAASCPHCGATLKRQPSVGCLGVFMILGLVAFIVTMLFSGANQKAGKSEAEVKASKEFAWIEKNKGYVKQNLRDPGSATFRNTRVVYVKDANDIPVVCGEVNSRNSFGGYVGFQRFISAGSTIFYIEGTKGFDDVWFDMCY